MIIGEELLSFVRAAQRDVLIVAPFMLAKPLSVVLEQCPAGARITCVTRWHPEEILQGVSDLEVMDVVSTRQDARLFLRPDLHAKLNRIDERALVGSANITTKALGWTRRPNLELMVSIVANDPAIVQFELVLLTGAKLADNYERERTQAIVDELRAEQQLARPLADIDEQIYSDFLQPNAPAWRPLCMTPDRLYRAHCGDTS